MVREAVEEEPVPLEAMQPQPLVAVGVLGQHPQ